MITWLIAAIQGITEFIPVSSSGHLLLIHELTGFNENALVLDIAAHVGTLLAGIIFFRNEVKKIIVGCFDIIYFKNTEAKLLVINLAIASISLVIIGAFLQLSGWYDLYFRSTLILAASNMFFGLLLLTANRDRAPLKSINELTKSHAFLIGLAQVLAFIPGASRSGVTMTAARLLGYDWKSSATFSLLMGMIAILAAAGGSALSLASSSVSTDLINDIIAVIAISFAASITTLPILFWLLNKVGIVPFVIYRVFFGVVLITIALT